MLALFLGACQPQSRRLLLLDLALTEPALLESTARPWADADYIVHYRRFYPHLTHQDVGAYHALVLLGGGTPEGSSDGLTAGDVSLLNEWLRRGGVVVFGYRGDGEGFFDRWVVNRWLEASGVGILIGDFALEDSTGPPPARIAPLRRGAVRDPGFRPVPAGRNHVLVVRNEASVLARGSRDGFVRQPGQPPAARGSAPVVAATRVGRGLFIVASRHQLAGAGSDARNAADPLVAPEDARRAQTFLTVLARWTRRPAEWASVPPAAARGRLVLAGSPLPVAARPPRLRPPAGADVLVLPALPPSAAESSPSSSPRGAQSWIARGGVRVLWARLPAQHGTAPYSVRARELDSVVNFLEQGAFNVLASVARDPQVVGDSARFRYWEHNLALATWRQTLDRLRATSVRWIPAVDPRAFRLPRDTLARGVRGDTLAAWCALDPRLWSEGLTPAYRALARLAAAEPDVVAGVALDLDLPGRGPTPGYGMGADFCDATWRPGIAGLVKGGGGGIDSARAARFAALPVETRYDSLLDGGLLGAYYGALEDAVAARAAQLRTDARRLARDLLFAFRSTAPPADWFALGVLRGFSGAGAPILLWTGDPHPGRLLERYRGRGIHALHAVGLSPAGVVAGRVSQLRSLVSGESNGFWLGPGRAPVPPDSLSRLLRRLAPQALPRPPAAR